MKLIIDCGSSRSKCLVYGTKTKPDHFEFKGFNPMLCEDIYNEAFGHFKLLQNRFVDIDEILYGGAGCVGSDIRGIMTKVFLKLYPKADVEVYDDLEFIGHLLRLEESCIIAIMGTGSNAGLWNKNEIATRELSGGYLLGDEGSGFLLGKSLIINYIRSRFSNETQAFLENRIGKNGASLLRDIYQSKSPNKVISSYAKYYLTFEDQLKEKLVKAIIQDFIESRILPIGSGNRQVHFFGSIAYYFSDYLIPILTENNLKLGIIAENPLDAFSKTLKSND